jgi:hypothetical protein
MQFNSNIKLAKQTIANLKNLLLSLWFSLMVIASFGQTHILKGIIIDDLSQKPVQGVTIKVERSKTGTFTDRNGRFSLPLKKLPVTLQLTAIGYETMMLDITRYVSDTVKIRIKSQIYMLEGVAISASPVIPVFKDDHYSVMDYEIMDDNLLLLVYRYRLKRSQLVLLTRLGDTLDYTDAPEIPSKLYKDALGNVHYVTQGGTAYQCFFYAGAKKLIFPYVTSYDSLYRLMKSYSFSIGDRLYFQEYSPDGFTTGIGYYEGSIGKHYARFITDEKRLHAKIKEQTTYNSLKDYEKRAWDMFYYTKMDAPMVKLGENKIAVINLSKDEIEIMDAEAKILSTVPISFHKEDDIAPLEELFQVFVSGKKKWGKKILVDEPQQTAYTFFVRNGIYSIKRINIFTGELEDCKDIPYIFPKKIQVYKGEVYFLYKGVGDKDKWNLLKMKVCN